MNNSASAPLSGASNPLKKLESFFEEYLVKKAPFTLPPRWKELIVKITPWANIIGFVILLPILLAVLGLYSAFSGLFFWNPYVVGSGWITLILIFATAILELIAVPGLFKRSIGAWRLLFYAVLLRAVTGIFHIDLGEIIGMVLSLYLLFQVKSYYK